MDIVGKKYLRLKRREFEELFGKCSAYPHVWRSKLKEAGVFDSELFTDGDKELMSQAPWILYLLTELLEEA